MTNQTKGYYKYYNLHKLIKYAYMRMFNSPQGGGQNFLNFENKKMKIFLMKLIKSKQKNNNLNLLKYIINLFTYTIYIYEGYSNIYREKNFQRIPRQEVIR